MIGVFMSVPDAMQLRDSAKSADHNFSASLDRQLRKGRKAVWIPSWVLPKSTPKSLRRQLTFVSLICTGWALWAAIQVSMLVQGNLLRLFAAVMTAAITLGPSLITNYFTARAATAKHSKANGVR